MKDFLHTPIPMVEIFQSISGEGVSSGNIVTFVRVAGCNLRCTWCDTKYSFQESGEGVDQLKPDEIVERVAALGSNELICTGGEPLEESKTKRFLPLYLASHEYAVHIETSGGSALYTEEEFNEYAVSRDDISYCMDIKCPGSGMAKNNILDNILLLKEGDELKFVVNNQQDLDFSLKIIDTYRQHLADENIALNFSPVFESLKPVVIVNFLKQHTTYFEENELWPRLNLQLHKFVWPPHQRGV